MSRSITSKFALLLLLLWPAASWAAVATDAFSQDNCNGPSDACTTDTVLTFAHTNSASVSNMAVAAFVACGGASTAPAISSVTYAGTTLTQLQAVNPAAARRGYLFGWPSGSVPTTGTNNVSVTLASSIDTACGGTSLLKAMVMSVTGSDTSSQYVTTNSNSGTGTTASLTMSSNPTGSMGFSAGCSGDGVTSSTEGAIDLTDSNTASSCGTTFGMDVAPTDASWSFTIPSDSWITVGAVFAAAGGGGGGSTQRNLMLLGVGQ